MNSKGDAKRPPSAPAAMASARYTPLETIGLRKVMPADRPAIAHSATFAAVSYRLVPAMRVATGSLRSTVVEMALVAPITTVRFTPSCLRTFDVAAGTAVRVTMRTGTLLRAATAEAASPEA